ncbi:MAG TPA: hypothetical protein EYO62_04590, partial [Aquificales bacterium]|nr:hypothetical protein [Aquificales bacterium]
MGKKRYREELYSEKNACPEHGISLPELSPRLFSFNSPYGACPDCKGLGVKWEIDPDSLVEENKPVEEAIKPLQSMLFNYLKFPLRRLVRLLGYS